MILFNVRIWYVGRRVEYSLGATQERVASSWCNVIEPEGVRHEPEGVRHEPEGVRNEPEGVRHEPEGVRHKPEGVRHEPEGVRHEPEGVRHEPEGVRHEPTARVTDKFSTRNLFDVVGTW
jgi:uncharacterized protein with von Willebrand factor type A (vWA) domain